MDQPENPKDIRAEKHVWVQAHQGLWPFLRWQPRTHGKYWAVCLYKETSVISLTLTMLLYFQVVFATPGMLHAGQSLQIFKKWAGNEKNMVRSTGGRRNEWKRRQKVSSVSSAVSGHHAGILCARNNRPQDSEWTEETGDGRESDSKMILFSFWFLPILSPQYESV